MMLMVLSIMIRWRMNNVVDEHEMVMTTYRENVVVLNTAMVYGVSNNHNSFLNLVNLIH